MNEQQARDALVKLWMAKAKDALDSARLEAQQDHISFAVNRLYYACFYAVTALLLKDGKQFKKHSAVKSEFVRNYIKSGKIDARWNRFYQQLFDDRQEGDYVPTAVFDKQDVLESLEQTEEFTNVINQLITKP